MRALVASADFPDGRRPGWANWPRVLCQPVAAATYADDPSALPRPCSASVAFTELLRNGAPSSGSAAAWISIARSG